MNRYTALLGRGREEFLVARRAVSGMSRGRLARWLALPGLYVWIAIADVANHPWHFLPMAVAAAALLARYRWPGASVAAVALISALPVAIPALPIVAYGAGRRLTTARQAVPCFAITVLAAVSNAFFWLPHSLSWPETAVLASGYVMTLILFPAAVGAIIGERGRRIETLRDRNAILEEAQHLGDLRARMQERARIAGEMHDLLGHKLSLISLYAGALELRTREQQPSLNSQAGLIRTTAGSALDELRNLLGILRVDAGGPSDETTDAEAGTKSDIAALAEASRAAGQPVTISWEGDDLTAASATVRRAVHRVVRESLTNVHKHAPHAPTHISVHHDGARATIDIRNPIQPPQTPPPSTGLGLAGLRERARLAGGTVSARQVDGEFVLTASLPISAPPALLDSRDLHIDQPRLAEMQTPSAVREGHARHSSDALPAGSTGIMSKTAKTIVAILIGTVILACGCVTIGGYILGKQAEKSAITPAQYATVQVGQTREQVKQTIGDVGSIGKIAMVDGKEPPAPAGSVCDYALSKENKGDGPYRAYRFCYVGDKLVEKRELIIDKEHTNP
ncbi:histidine kinase [Dactylosporangium sp. NPDC051484]|uniref:histidine kinase n=1 Tax=Dactylosporangium sp. NPDC051484 TaxID=3154942 RepID=UPI00344C0196